MIKTSIEWTDATWNPRRDEWIAPNGEMRGDYLVIGDACVRRMGKKAAGDLLDGVQWHQFPERAGCE